MIFNCRVEPRMHGAYSLMGFCYVLQGTLLWYLLEDDDANDNIFFHSGFQNLLKVAASS